MRWATVAVVVVVAATLALLIRPPLKDPELAHELISMQRAIDKYAVRFNRTGPINIGDLSEALQNRITDAEAIDKTNTDRLARILDEHGWPTYSQVGKEAAFAAMNVVGRAQDVEFKARALRLMDKAGVEHNPQYARIVDIVAVNKGEPQTYGTQWSCADEGHVKLTTPLKDPNRVKELRREAGLPPYDQFAGAFCADPSVGREGVIIPRR